MKKRVQHPSSYEEYLLLSEKDKLRLMKQNRAEAMNVREIVEAHLRQVGAEGLCLDECGCRMLDLMPCGGGWEDCVPAVRVKCDERCERCEGNGCMVPMPEIQVAKSAKKRSRRHEINAVL